MLKDIYSQISPFFSFVGVGSLRVGYRANVGGTPAAVTEIALNVHAESIRVHVESTHMDTIPTAKQSIVLCTPWRSPFGISELGMASREHGIAFQALHGL